MQTVSNVFYIVVFTSLFGSALFILLSLIQAATRIFIPHWVLLTDLILFVLPITTAGAHWISPADNVWMDGFIMASKIWLIGMVYAGAAAAAIRLAARRVYVRCTACSSGRLTDIFTRSVQRTRLRRQPTLLCGTFHEPAFVVGSTIIINEPVLTQLTNEEIDAVFSHELVHIRRQHGKMRILADIICCIHWFNPLIWIAKSSFATSLELDCDRQTLSLLGASCDGSRYAMVMFRLMELSHHSGGWPDGKNGALDFLLAKQRFQCMLARHSRLRIRLCACLYILIIGVTMIISVKFSDSYFSPYAGLPTGVEWSDDYANP